MGLDELLYLGPGNKVFPRTDFENAEIYIPKFVREIQNKYTGMKGRAIEGIYVIDYGGKLYEVLIITTEWFTEGKRFEEGINSIEVPEGVYNFTWGSFRGSLTIKFYVEKNVNIKEKIETILDKLILPVNPKENNKSKGH